MTEYLEINDERELRNLNPKSCDKIKSLNLFAADFTSFPHEICQMSNLKSLAVIGLSENLPKEIGQLKSLKCLHLQYTHENLPKEIGQLKSLKRLHLCNHKLIRLPAEIGQLSNLEYLYVECFKLENLPKEIGQLKSLKELHLERTQFENLPKEIGQLKSLEELNLIGTNLTSLPVEIGQLSYNLKAFVMTPSSYVPYHKIKVPTSLTKFLIWKLGRNIDELFEFIQEKVINPKTNRYIIVGKSTYNKLVKEGLIKEPY